MVENTHDVQSLAGARAFLFGRHFGLLMHVHQCMSKKIVTRRQAVGHQGQLKTRVQYAHRCRPLLG